MGSETKRTLHNETRRSSFSDKTFVEKIKFCLENNSPDKELASDLFERIRLKKLSGQLIVALLFGFKKDQSDPAKVHILDKFQTLAADYLTTNPYSVTSVITILRLKGWDIEDEITSEVHHYHNVQKRKYGTRDFKAKSKAVIRGVGYESDFGHGSVAERAQQRARLSLIRVLCSSSIYDETMRAVADSFQEMDLAEFGRNPHQALHNWCQELNFQIPKITQAAKDGLTEFRLELTCFGKRFVATFLAHELTRGVGEVLALRVLKQFTDHIHSFQYGDDLLKRDFVTALTKYCQIHNLEEPKFSRGRAHRYTCSITHPKFGILHVTARATKEHQQTPARRIIAELLARESPDSAQK